MCTVVFIPEGDKYFFASLRDESPLRPVALVPEIRSTGDAQILSPMDAKAGGTWIGITAKGSVIILLNGGFENHNRKSSYKKSRGLIVNELLHSALPVKEWNLMNMENIEPFTLVVWTENNLYQLVWDGSNKNCNLLPHNIPAIWSSATLYDKETRIYRKNLFQNWINANPSISMMEVLNFFKSYTDNYNGFLMNRGEKIKTLSYSFIEFYPGESARIDYYDFSNDTFNQKKLKLNAIKDSVAAAAQVL